MSCRVTKITAHIYNSTQRIKIEGKGFRDFVDNVLEPHFSKIIQSQKSEIAYYDANVLETLTSKKVKRSNVKSSFSCQHCEFLCKTAVTLNKHKISSHSDMVLVGAKLIHSSEENTTENTLPKIMNEDISVVDVYEAAAVYDVEETVLDIATTDHGKDLLSIEFVPTDVKVTDNVPGINVVTLEELENEVAFDINCTERLNLVPTENTIVEEQVQHSTPLKRYNVIESEKHIEKVQNEERHKPGL